MKTKILLTLLFAFFCASGLSWATEEPRETRPVIAMDEVVVTATRQEEKINSVPANVTVIDKTEIKNSTAGNIPELLRTQVGVLVNDIAGNKRNYTVDLRGFGEAASLNTLVLVDGRRINQSDLSGVDWTLIPLDRVQRIEIVRGGRGSVLYGDNAAGGVINIITEQGEEFAAGGELTAGSYETFKGNAFMSGSAKDLSYAVSASYLTSDGYRENSDTKAKDAGIDLGYYLSDRVKLNLSSGYHEDDTGLPGAIKTSDFTSGTSRTDTLYPDDYADIEDYYFKGGPEIYIFNDSTIRLDASYRKRNFLSFASFAAGNFTGDTDIETVTLSPQIIYREKVFGLDNRLTLGLDYTTAKEDITNESVFFGFPSVATYQLEKENYGYYIHDEIRPLQQVAVSGGFRHDRARFDFKPITTGPDHLTVDEDALTAGISYTFLDRSSVYLSYSRSFRYPVLDEFFSYFTNTLNTDLLPQTSDDYEIGVRHYFTENLFAGVNFFRIDTEDEIYYDPDAFENKNLDGKTRRDGVEVSLTKTLDWATLSGSYTYTEATIDGGQYDGNKFPNVPEHRVALNTVFYLPYGFSFAVNGNYVGQRPLISDFSNALEDQEDYLVVNTKLMLQRKYVTPFLTINNITNEEYSEYGGVSTFPIVEPGFFPSPKINFLVGVSGQF